GRHLLDRPALHCIQLVGGYGRDWADVWGNGINGDHQTVRVSSRHPVRLLVHLDAHTLHPADLLEGVDDLSGQQTALRIWQSEYRITERHLGNAVGDAHRVDA